MFFTIMPIIQEVFNFEASVIFIRGPILGQS